MPAVVTRLRIAGFKSFAEPATIDILPGLTGIVGPNGCGKSNVVEALRWAMGETSARSLRGGEMDEVIFAGSAARASRNIAEVVVTLDEATGLAPPPLHGEAELQVSRQIERGAGSRYRVNGREMRARDVQTMFADIASGARSSAMVSQGRVAFLVDARPDERRSVLEEAAGITGLHARRHEAELRLRAAESNLARVADLRTGLEGQHAALARQAVTARAYREAVDELMAAERRLLAVLVGRAARAKVETGRALADARAALQAAERDAGDAEAAERAAETGLAERSQALSVAIATAERARAGFGAADADLARVTETLESAERRLAEVTRDHELALSQSAETQAFAAGLAQEAEALAGFLDEFEGRHQALVALREAAGASVRREADAAEARGRADRERTSLEAGRASIMTRLEATGRALADANRTAPAPGELEEAAEALNAGELAAAAARAGLAATGEALRAALDALASVRREEAALRDALSRAETRASEALRRRDRIALEHGAVTTRRSDVILAGPASGSAGLAGQAAAQAAEAFDAGRKALDTEERARRVAEASAVTAGAAAAAAAARAGESAASLARERRERERLQGQRATLAAEHAEACAALVAEPVLAGARVAVGAAVERVEAGRRRASKSERGRDEAAAAAAAARAAIASRDASCLAAETEIEALSRVVGGEELSLFNAIEVPEALEAAVAAGLGEALAASLEPEAARFWRVLDPLEPCPALPAGVARLAGLLEAPPALARVLSQVGLLNEGVDGTALMAALSPGQILVSREGGSFRWDGHVARSGQPSPMEERLRARRRLGVCETALAEARASLPSLRAKLDEAMARGQAFERNRLDARAAVEAGERAIAEAAAAEMALSARAAAARARVEGLDATLSLVSAALDEALDCEREARAASENADDPEALSRFAEDRAAEAAAALAAERRAGDELRAAEATRFEREAEARRLAAREAEAAATLAALDPALARLREELAAAQAELEGADADHRAAAQAVRAHDVRRLAAESDLERAVSEEDARREAREHAEAAVGRLRAAHEAVLSQAGEADARLARLVPEQETLQREHLGIEARLAAARAERAALGEEAGALEAARRVEAETQLRVAALEAQAGQARSRMASIAGETADANRRVAQALARAAELTARLDETRRAQAALREVPSDMAERRRAAETAFAAAEAARVEAASAALAAQAEMSARRDARRAADLATADAREACSKEVASAAQAAAFAAEIEARVRDAGAEIEASAEVTAAAETEARRRVARALKTRDDIGPVNLLAEREADEVGERLAALVREASELDEAVARLRGSIGHLNREGRERLSASFMQIDAQFRALFGRMFDGGRAHLALVGSDDPLEAGLEIYAQPPGKKLATLSLLSGGEQALTALSLIFAVFRCNPAPVCVLDEVDAPLDDANVERFCRLVSDMAKETATRFLLVTHHQLTMANMDRLYGVTMQERGVSRLLSVDLGRAVEMAAS